MRKINLFALGIIALFIGLAFIPAGASQPIKTEINTLDYSQQWYTGIVKNFDGKKLIILGLANNEERKISFTPVIAWERPPLHLLPLLMESGEKVTMDVEMGVIIPLFSGYYFIHILNR